MLTTADLDSQQRLKRRVERGVDMPDSKYNQFFGGKPGAAAKARGAMVEQYGAKRGKRVFYATMNKRKKRLLGVIS